MTPEPGVTENPTVQGNTVRRNPTGGTTVTTLDGSASQSQDTPTCPVVETPTPAPPAPVAKAQFPWWIVALVLIAGILFGGGSVYAALGKKRKKETDDVTEPVTIV